MNTLLLRSESIRSCCETSAEVELCHLTRARVVAHLICLILRPRSIRLKVQAGDSANLEVSKAEFQHLSHVVGIEFNIH
jgi:hypothetical protein